MLGVAVAFAAGICTGRYFGFAGMAIVMVILTVLLILSRRTSFIPLPILFMCGTLCYWAHLLKDTIATDRQGIYSGVVTRVSEGAASDILTLRIDSLDGRRISPCRSEIVVPYSAREFNEFDRLRFTGNLLAIVPHCDLPDEEDPAVSKINQGIFRSGLVLADSIRSVSEEKTLYAKMRGLNKVFLHTLMTSGLNDSSKDFIATCLLGNPDSLTAERRGEYSQSGLAHILALSGMHVAIISGILCVILMPVRMLRQRWIFPLSLTAALWCFAVMTGLSPSVVRAVIIATIFALSTVLKRKTEALNSLSVAALVMLIIDPMNLFSIGFQLSFASVGGIILFGPHFSFWQNKDINRIRFGTLVGSSIAAVLATSAITAYYFHSIPLLFLPANIIVLPLLLPVAMVSGILVCLTTALHIPDSILCFISDFTVGIIDSTAKAISSVPLASVETGEIGIVTVISTFVCLFTLKIWFSRKRKVWLAATFILGASSLYSCTMTDLPGEGTEVYFTYPDGYKAQILIRHDDSILVATDAVPGDYEHMTANIKKRYGRYMRRRHIRNIIFLPDKYTSREVVKNGKWLWVNGRTIVLIDRDGLPACTVDKLPNADYAVVSPSFHGRLTDIPRHIAADSIVTRPSRSSRVNGMRQ